MYMNYAFGTFHFPNWFGPAVRNLGTDLQSVMTPCLLPAEYRATDPAEVPGLYTLNIAGIPGCKKS